MDFIEQFSGLLSRMKARDEDDTLNEICDKEWRDNELKMFEVSVTNSLGESHTELIASEEMAKRMFELARFTCYDTNHTATLIDANTGELLDYYKED